MERAGSVLSRLGLAIGVAFASLGAGCESSDLSKKADITSGVAECLPPGTPDPTVVVRAIWFPNVDGFGSTDSESVHVTGVLALAGKNVWFMGWNDPEHHFDMLHVIAVLQAEKVTVARLGPTAMLVIRSGNDSVDSFELMNESRLGSDSQATQDLCDRLQALRLKNPEPDPGSR